MKLQHLAILLLLSMAVHATQGFFFKLPKLGLGLLDDEDADEHVSKKGAKLLKKLDFLNLFEHKKEAKLDKIEHEFEKFKEWFDHKKQKTLELLEDKIELKEEKKAAKKAPKKSYAAAKPDCYEPVLAHPHPQPVAYAYAEPEQEPAYASAEYVQARPKAQACNSCDSYAAGYDASSYEAAGDAVSGYGHGNSDERYFT